MMRRSAEARSEQGQALVIVAIAMVGLMGFLGLVVDVGWGMYQKRIAQNGADAAALAAIREIANSGTSCAAATLTSAIEDLVETYVEHNAGGDATTDWEYIDNTGSVVADASACTATGVRVTATVSYNTFFLGVLGIGSATTTATAGGRVRVLNGYGGGPPFVACGTALIRTSDKANINVLDSSTNPPSIDETYVGMEFDLHGPQIAQDGGNCGLADASFKGNASDTQNGCASLPCDYGVQNGNRAGPTLVRVAGAAPGCDESAGSDVDDCILILPLADGVGSVANSLNTVTWAAFLVNRVSANEHTGVLQGVVFLQGTSTDWVPGTSAPLVLALTQ